MNKQEKLQIYKIALELLIVSRDIAKNAINKIKETGHQESLSLWL